MELMAIADGKVPEAKLNAEQASIVEGVNTLGEGVRSYCELSTDSVATKLDAAWSQIEAHLVSADGSSAAKQKRTLEGKSSGFPQQKESGWESKTTQTYPAWQRWWPGAVAGAVVAAATLVFVYTARPFERVIVTNNPPATSDDWVAPSVPSIGNTGHNSNKPKASMVSLPHSPPEVENLEVYSGSGFILTIPGDSDEADTAVIWVTPEESQKGDQL